ncbi:MAG: hypothetical protein QM820_39935 [Minicystis sp.]
MSPPRTLAAACAIGICALGAPARAANPAAKAQLSQGLADMAAKRYDKACPAIEASYKLDPLPRTLFSLAECEEKRGRIATAWAHYDEYVTLSAKQKKPADHDKAAREQRALLEPQIPQLTLSLPPGAPAGTVVERDGEKLAPTALGTAQRVDPGEHLVTTRGPGGESNEIRVTIAKGEKKQVTVSLKGAPSKGDAAASKGGSVAPSKDGSTAPSKGGSDASPPAEASAPAASGGSSDRPSQPTSGRRIAVYVTGAVGVAGLVVGGVTGVLAVQKKGVLDKNCGAVSGYPGDPKGCNAFGVTTLKTAKAFALTSTIGLSVGAAGVITAGILFLTEPKRPASHASRNVQVGVLSAGPEGATIGAYGAW